MLRAVLKAVLCLAIASAVASFAATPAPRVESIASASDAKAMLTGIAPVAAFIFVNAECPISNKYAPEIQRLATQFAGKDIQLILVYPDAVASAADVAKHLAAYQLSARAVHDPKQLLVNACGVTITPEAAVFSRGQLVYRGRINDRFASLGVERAETKSNDLEDVIKKIVAGEIVTFKSVPAVGCYISPQ